MPIKLQILLNFRENVSWKSTGNHTCWSVRHPVKVGLRLCAGRWHLWADTPLFGWTLWRAGSSDQDPVWSTELPCCRPRRLELAAYTPALNVRQSWTVQRWDEDWRPITSHSHCTGWPKNGTVIMYGLTLPSINRFSKLFHCQNKENICNNTITKDPTTPQVCRYTTLWNVKCLKSNSWKQDDLCIYIYIYIYNNTF